MAKRLHAGDIIHLINPGYGQPSGNCVVIVDQQGNLVWFRASEPTLSSRGPCFVARRTEVKVIRRQNTPEESCS